MRQTWLGGPLGLLLLTGCESEPQISFAQPFPLSAPALQAFPARHQGTYGVVHDSTFRTGTYRMTIARHAIWSEMLLDDWVATRKLDSLGLSAAPGKIKAWQTAADNTSYRVLKARPDSVWLEFWVRDTVCVLTPGTDKQVRWFRGAYYLSSRANDTLRKHWETERLVPHGRRLSWQTLGHDTLRIAALPAGVVRRDTTGGHPAWLLRPGTRRQERQIADYAGLWHAIHEFSR